MFGIFVGGDTIGVLRMRFASFPMNFHKK